MAGSLFELQIGVESLHSGSSPHIHFPSVPSGLVSQCVAVATSHIDSLIVLHRHLVPSSLHVGLSWFTPSPSHPTCGSSVLPALLPAVLEHTEHDPSSWHLSSAEQVPWLVPSPAFPPSSHLTLINVNTYDVIKQSLLNRKYVYLNYKFYRESIYYPTRCSSDVRTLFPNTVRLCTFCVTCCPRTSTYTNIRIAHVSD